MERTMKRYRIGVAKIELIGFSVTGERAISVRFIIKPVSGGSTVVYEGNSGGSEFISRCKQLELQPIVVEAPEPTSATFETWKEEIVRRALASIAL